MGGGLGVNLAIRQITGLVFSGAALFSPFCALHFKYPKRCTVQSGVEINAFSKYLLAKRQKREILFNLRLTCQKSIEYR
jgi:hypothetical protein